MEREGKHKPSALDEVSCYMKLKAQCCAVQQERGGINICGINTLSCHTQTGFTQTAAQSSVHCSAATQGPHDAYRHNSSHGRCCRVYSLSTPQQRMSFSQMFTAYMDSPIVLSVNSGLPDYRGLVHSIVSIQNTTLTVRRSTSNSGPCAAFTLVHPRIA